MNDYKIKKLYENMEIELIDSMRRNLSRHLTEEDEVGFKYTQWQAEKLKELKRFQRQNKKLIGGYVKGLNKEISNHLQEELKQGSISAIKQYNKLLGDNKNPSKLMNKSFFRTNDRKVKALIKAVNNDLNDANTGALRMINDEYRQIIHKSAFFVANGVKTEQQATGMAIKEISEKKATMLACDEVSKTFLAGGLNCIEYRNGRRVNIASYAAMAVRTASLRAHLMGEGDFRKSIGRSLVKVTTHGGACKLCTKWQGKVLIDDVYSGGEPDGKHQLLSEAMKQGFLHPNCRHGITTYYPELEGISYDEDEGDEYLPEELKEKLQYLNLNIKRFSRENHGFIDSDNRKDARKNYLACEKKKYQLLNLREQQNQNMKYYFEHKTTFANSDYYEDITLEFLNDKIPNSHNVELAKEIKIGNKVFKPNKQNKFNFTNNEIPVAEWIKETIGGPIKLRFEIGEERYLSSADYDLWDELWDLKETKTGGSKYTFGHDITNQAENFIFDVSGNKKMTDKLIAENMENVFKYKKNVQTIIIKRDKQLLGIYKKKK